MKKATRPPDLSERFFQNFDGERFDNLKASIQSAIDKSAGFCGLKNNLSALESVQYVEESDNDLENDDFLPGYVGTEPDSCDFIVLLCYAELATSKIHTASEYVEVCFHIVWNDVMSKGWIEAALLSVASKPNQLAEPLCFFDINTHEPIIWSDEENDD